MRFFYVSFFLTWSCRAAVGLFGLFLTFLLLTACGAGAGQGGTALDLEGKAGNVASTTRRTDADNELPSVYAPRAGGVTVAPSGRATVRGGAVQEIVPAGGGATTSQAAAQSNATKSGPTVNATSTAASMGQPAKPPVQGEIAECWRPLVEKLQKDPNADPELVTYFCSLPEYSSEPMCVKVKELFTSAFMRKSRKPDDGKPKLPPSRIYRSVVTEANVRKCKTFLAENKQYFAAVEKKYPVSKEILVSLLFVETRLGTYIGKENAFWSLACMAAADRPDRVSDGLGGIPIKDEHGAWLQDKLTDKSGWAYKELRALLRYCSVQQLDPHTMPGSVYGAIGICQFMPSNLVPYGDDGDGDGVVNLFSVPDAIFSAALYLTKHGWKKDLTVARQRAVLKRYNNLNIYANTILAMAESLRTGVLQTGPPDAAAGASKKRTSKPKPKKQKSKAKKTTDAKK